MAIAVIPARGGSKRIAKKNIRLFAGKPLIAYAINAAKESGAFSEIIVSTDSEEIAQVATEYGATVPFMRPNDLADDYTSTAKVMQHAFKWLLENGSVMQYGCCIYATAAFVRPEFLRKGYQIIRNKKVSSAFAVTSYEFPIFRSLKINDAGYLEMLWSEHELTRSQNLPEAYHDAGQFYWVEIKRFLRTHQFYSPDALPVMIPRYLVQDIDTEEDWVRAELMYQASRNMKLL